MKKRKEKIGAGEIIWFIILLILAISIIYPLFWVVMSSFKSYSDIFNNVWGLPEEWHFENYPKAWSKGISQYFVNSLIVTIATLIGVVVIATAGSFGIVQMRGKIANIIFLLCMFGLLLSPQVCVLPLFILLKALKLKNTYWAMILPYIAFRLPISIMLVRAYFLSISKELQEAATIDGASLMQIYTKIYLPLSTPILSTVSIMTCYYAWNEFLFATIFVDSSKLRTIPVGLKVFSDGLMSDWGVILAGMTISCIPLVLLFVILQKNFIRGITAGAVKG